MGLSKLYTIMRKTLIIFLLFACSILSGQNIVKNGTYQWTGPAYFTGALVGIGTVSPLATLHVYDPGGSIPPFILQHFGQRQFVTYPGNYSSDQGDVDFDNDGIKFSIDDQAHQFSWGWWTDKAMVLSGSNGGSKYFGFGTSNPVVNFDIIGQARLIADNRNQIYSYLEVDTTQYPYTGSGMTTVGSYVLNSPSYGYVNDWSINADSGGIDVCGGISMNYNSHVNNYLYTLPKVAPLEGQTVIADAYGNTNWIPLPFVILYSQTDTTQTVNDTTQHSLVKTGVGSMVIPANMPIGTTYQLNIRGFHSNNSFDNLVVRIKIDSITVDSAIVNSGPGVIGGAAGITANLNIYSTGNTGKYWIQGAYSEEGSTNSGMPTTAAKTLNSNVSHTVDVTIQWKTKTASDSWTVTNLTFDQRKP